MRKLSDLYSGIFQTQSSGFSSETSQILENPEHLNSHVSFKLYTSHTIFEYSIELSTRESGRGIWNGPLQNYEIFMAVSVEIS